MKAWSDEEVSAYLDGALKPAEAEEFAASLAADAELAARLEAMRRADLATKEAFNAPLEDAIPERFRALVMDDTPAAPPAPEIVDLAAARSQRRRQTFDYRIPLAASIALAVGWLGGTTVTPNRAPDQAIALSDAAAIDPASPLSRLLTETPSAQAVTFADANGFKPVLSFVAADGRLCREFELTSPDAASVGVACREPQAWRLEALLAAGAAPAVGQGYAQASGYNAAALDAVVADLGAGEPLAADAERRAIAEGWTSP